MGGGIVVWHVTLATNVIHDLVFAFAWDTCIGKDDFELELRKEQ